MKKQIMLVLTVLLFCSCTNRIAVRTEGVSIIFLQEDYSKAYTLLIPETQSYEYLLLQTKLPFILYALHLNGYKFKGFNNSNYKEAPTAILVSLKQLKSSYWEHYYNHFQDSVISREVSITDRLIAFAAFDNKTKSALWQTVLVGWGREMERSPDFKIPAILFLGHKYIDKKSSVTLEDDLALNMEEYNSFINRSIRFYEDTFGFEHIDKSGFYEKREPNYNRRGTITNFKKRTSNEENIPPAPQVKPKKSNPKGSYQRNTVNDYKKRNN